MAYAEIIFRQKVGKLSSSLSYQIPADFKLKPSQLVQVPLKKSLKTGLVWRIFDKKPDFKTIDIKEILSEQPLLSENQIHLINWLAEYYFCPIDKIIKLFIPKRVFENKKITKKLEQKINSKIKADTGKELTKEQKDISDTIFKSPKNKFLIHGITGSGKTEVYVTLAKEFLKNDQQVLILVPEISLTPQTVSYFEKSLGVRATVINSKLSEGEKQSHWRKIYQNEAKLIIGSRSAIFAPFQSLGLIIMDEEHESSYKQDSAPRYLLHKVIDKLLELDPKIKVVLGSATPSVETSFELKDNTFHLDKRIGNTPLPQIEIVDLREEFKKKNYSIFSDSLHAEIEKVIEENSQAILFLNRRGKASSVVCRDCGYVAKCPTCDLAMTYHEKTLGKPCMICHHCGRIENPPALCPNCQGTHIRYLGIGTQRIEEEVKKIFPKAKVLRADKDTTGTKHGFKEIYESFKSGEAQILIGTQMIAKGLDISNVNLVGVVLADIGLNIPDFRTMEKNFELMTQISGRAGRREKQGKVIIQTYNPENIALKFTQEQEYDNFFKYEITQRKLLKNPPFGQLAKITIQEKSFAKSKSRAEQIENRLRSIVQDLKLEDVDISLYPAYVIRLRGNFRHIVLIKSLNGENHKLLEKLPKEDIMDPNLKIDIDPLLIN